MGTTLQENNLAAHWRELFANWPEVRPRKGLIITSWNETISFDSYLMTDDVLLVSRPQPDSMGARKILLPFSKISAVKLTDVFELDEFSSVGFH